MAQTLRHVERSSQIVIKESRPSLLRKPPGHIWATSAREYGVKQAVSSQPRALRINTGYNSDMPGSHEVESSNLSRSTN